MAPSNSIGDCRSMSNHAKLTGSGKSCNFLLLQGSTFYRQVVKWSMPSSLWPKFPNFVQKSLSNIWQGFSHLLDEDIAKICKKLNSSMNYLHGSVTNPAHAAALFSLSCFEKAIVGFIFLDIVAISSSSRHKNIVKLNIRQYDSR